MKIKQNIVRRLERGVDHLFNGRAAWNPPHGRDIDDDRGAVIAGNAKKDLSEFRIEISLPGVITGTTYRIHWPEGIPVVAIPFDSEVGPFSVNVSLRDIA